MIVLYNAPSSYYSMIARYALIEAGVPFNNRRMDIHLAKEQLSPWYIDINPAMTVPSMTSTHHTWCDSRDILQEAAKKADTLWLDADTALQPQIQAIVAAHYQITIEHLTFAKALWRFPLLRVIVPAMLRRIIRTLEAERKTSPHLEAVNAKIALNQQRLAYFTQGSLEEKLQKERDQVKTFLSQLPQPQQFLLGDTICSADIVTVIFCARLKMIGEFDLMPTPTLVSWFERMQHRQAYKDADIWTHFSPWRIIFKR